MMRVLISVEGKSEFEFVESVLTPHFFLMDIFISPQNMRGNISLDRVGQKLNALINNYDFVTTLYDFYGFKKRGLSKNETNKSLKDKLNNKIKADQQNKFIPYIQMYEFEALLFSNSEKMAKELNTKSQWIDEVLSEFNNNPEQINNSKETAPSKLIKKQTQYLKTAHAPKILRAIGLATIREKCSGFDAWLTQLEKLGE